MFETLFEKATSKTRKRVEQLAIEHITPEVVRVSWLTSSRSEDAAFLRAISVWPRFTPWHASLLRAAQNTSLGALRFRKFLSKEYADDAVVIRAVRLFDARWQSARPYRW